MIKAFGPIPSTNRKNNKVYAYLTDGALNLKKYTCSEQTANQPTKI